MNEDETLCMDQVYDALDWYKKAVIETREIEVRAQHTFVVRPLSFLLVYLVIDVVDVYRW